MPGDAEQDLLKRAEEDLQRELKKLRQKEGARDAGTPATHGVAGRIRNKSAADAARQAGYEVADMVHEKQLAYGDAASLQRGLWQVLLAQYEVDDGPHAGGTYTIPAALFDHVPRLTRVFDRVARLVANPEKDALGEDPWRDMAGDCIVGIIMPRTPVPADHAPCSEGDCQRAAGHEGPHRTAHSGGVQEWERRGRV